VTDPRVARLFADVAAGRVTRRQALSLGLRLGVATSALTALWQSAPAGAAPAPAHPFAFSASDPVQAEATGTFTHVREGSSPDIDPHVAYDNMTSGIYEMLVRYKDSATDEIEPMLAESWETSEDGSAVTFKLAPGALFHDGSPADAQAVKDSFTRFLELNTGPVMVLKRFMSTPEQMEVVDATTITFSLDRPSPLFLLAMASEYGPLVVNPHMVEEHKTDEDPWAHEWFLINASGTGPYMLQENLPSEQVVLTKFEAYHGGWDRPHFDKIVVRIIEEAATRRQLLESGGIDALTQTLTPDDVDALKSNENLNIELYNSTAVYWAIMNAPRLLTKEARQGFSYAFPYDDVINGAYRGQLTRSGPLASSVIGSDPDVFLYQTDLEKAKELILAAGFKEGDVFDFWYQSGDEVERVISQLFQANVEAMGFTLEVVEVDRAALGDLVYGDSPAEERPMFVGGWNWFPDYNDPFNHLDPNFSPKDGAGISNGGWWVNDRFSELMALSQNFQTEEELIAWMKEIQNILTEQDPPVIYYGEAVWYTIMQNDIQGFVPNPLYLSSYNFVDMYRGEPA
jgi:peptide/nickel transport system substrate-binding protein